MTSELPSEKSSMPGEKQEEVEAGERVINTGLIVGTKVASEQFLCLS